MDFRPALGALAVAAVMAAAPAAQAASQPSYPATRTEAVTETQFGVQVKDPYRWLENDVRNDPAVKAWVEAQNKVTGAYLAGLPGRDAIKARLTQLWNFERFGLPVKKGGRYFFARNSGLQNQSVLFVQDGLEGTPRPLIDPNTWSKDGATALGEWVPSEDGKRVLYSVQDGGSDWRTVKVLDVDSGQVLADEVKWVKFSALAWNADGTGFYYSRFPAPEAGAAMQALNLNHAIHFHRLGTPQDRDTLVHATPDRPKLNHVAVATEDKRWLMILSSEGTDDRYEVHLADMRDPAAKPKPVVKGLEHSYSLAGSDGDRLYLVTNKDAPRYRVVALDAKAPGAAMTPVVAEGANTIDEASLVGGRLVVNYKEDAKSVVRLYDLQGKEAGQVPLPGIGSVSGFGGEADDPETFYSFSSFNAPTTIYRFDTKTGASTVFKKPDTPFDAGQYQVSQVFYTSKDGTRVPMFIAHRKGLDLSKGAPTLLYGYGGFNVSLLPAFSVSRLAWMEMGGVFALANLRGGGEYGKAWHDAGKLLAKQNVFDDFIAAAEHLVKQGITTKDKLAIQGGSNGGLLVGAVLNQRPDLFAVGLPDVGVMDMTRYDRFTAGRYWVDDYGNPAEEKHFRNLLSYSPYHNIKAGTSYPAILVTTADTDDRVVPGHSFKYAAALQAADLGPKPRLIRIETRAGHGSGKPTDKLIEQFADLWAFTAFHTGLTLPGQ
ncbi:MAG TPA: prolyl oligopeptidase family serine peptidase [Azospirillaceae bacterium]|nr:prolyl oligopeptidase family serine peptidase [Azospirillaceae bacterium]